MTRLKDLPTLRINAEEKIPLYYQNKTLNGVAGEYVLYPPATPYRFRLLFQAAVFFENGFPVLGHGHHCQGLGSRVF